MGTEEGAAERFFILKLADGAVRELAFSEATRSGIAHLCRSLNKDPIDKTSDMPRYLAGTVAQLIADVQTPHPRAVSLHHSGSYHCFQNFRLPTLLAL